MGPALTLCPAPKAAVMAYRGSLLPPWLEFSFCQRSEQKPKTPVLKPPPQSSGLPQTQWHLLSSVKASAELFFLLRAEHLRTSCRKKKKPWQFSSPLFPNCAACIHSCIQTAAAEGQAAVGGSSVPAGWSLPRGQEVPWQGAETWHSSVLVSHLHSLRLHQSQDTGSGLSLDWDRY